ncbi:MAG: TolC family protein, partial [Acidobacteria bacterium]|nr:TolC family protein [Acidobacteriota bacterium]
MWRVRLGPSLILIVLTLVAVEGTVVCQGGRLGLEGAVDLARRNYPAIRAARAEEGAAAAGADAARASLLPRVELDWQQTRGTRNNIFGPFFPQGSVNPISGPLLDRTSISESVWGSGGGLAVSWELFDF